MTKSTAVAIWAEFAHPHAEVRKPPRPHQAIRRLFWAYFWLLLLEGVLRKWVAPSLAQPLLLIRDPIAIAMLGLGIHERLFNRNLVFYLLSLLALGCVAASVLVLPSAPMLTLYGFRCDFLHWPVLFVAPAILDAADLRRIGNAVLISSVPIALLMVYQFRSPSDSWINSGLDNTFKQMTISTDHVRPPGPFSFISGPVSFYALAAGFLVSAALARQKINRPLIIVGSVALIVASVFGGSRSLLAGVAIVVMVGLVAAVAVDKKLLRRYAGALIVFGTVAAVATTSSLMEDSASAFQQRLDLTSTGEGGIEGFVDRSLGWFTHSVDAAHAAPLAGAGLGVGTPVGSVYMTGSAAHFLLAEEEWPRVILESGPVLGYVFLAFRASMVVWLGWLSLQSARRGSPLAMCLFAAAAPNLLAGSFSQTTTLGFTMFTAGLCLAATKLPEPEE